MMRFGHLILIAVGWRLTMAYPLDDSAEQLAISVVIGTLGVVLVAFTTYCIGYDRGQAARPSEQRRAEDGG